MSVPLEVRRFGSWTPVAITSEAVRAHTGPFGAVGRALDTLGANTQCHEAFGMRALEETGRVSCTSAILFFF